jgi:hypothetical protein
VGEGRLDLSAMVIQGTDTKRLAVIAAFYPGWELHRRTNGPFELRGGNMTISDIPA